MFPLLSGFLRSNYNTEDLNFVLGGTRPKALGYLETQYFLLQLLLEIQELFNRQFLLHIGPKEVCGQRRIHALKQQIRI